MLLLIDDKKKRIHTCIEKKRKRAKVIYIQIIASEGFFLTCIYLSVGVLLLEEVSRRRFSFWYQSLGLSCQLVQVVDRWMT
jgi:hypothetical protein